LRNVLRGRVTSVMTVVSVAMALGVAISYFIAMTSFERSLVRSFQDDRWDAAADFLAPVWDDELTVLDGVAGVSEVEPYLRGAVRLLGGARTRSSLVTGIDPESSLRRVAVVEGRGLRAGDEDVFLLERQAAQELGFKLGDTVAVESRGKRFEARLVGLFSGVLPAETYAPRGTVRRWLDLDEQSTGVFLRAVGEPAALVAPLFEIDRVGRVTLKSQLVRDLLKIVDEIFVILYIAEAFSIAVAVLFVFSIASFLVLERRSEYDMLRILGFRDRTVGGIILGEIVLLGLLGAALAVPLGYGLAVFLTARMSAAWFTVDVTVAWRDVLVIVIPALLVLPLAAWPAIREIRSSSLTKTLRERMFG